MSRPRDKRFSIDDAFEEEQTTPQTHSASRTYKCVEDTASKDSDSLIHEVVGGETCCWRHPQVQENWKTVSCAAALLVLGAALLVASAFLFAGQAYNIGGVFLFAGLMLFSPGAYHVVYIWLAARGRRGYDFYHLPLFTR